MLFRSDRCTWRAHRSLFQRPSIVIGERTLRAYSQPVNLKRFDKQHWMTTDQPIWFIVYYLFEIPHRRLLTPGMVRKLNRVDERTFQAEIMGKAYKKK